MPLTLDHKISIGEKSEEYGGININPHDGLFDGFFYFFSLMNAIVIHNYTSTFPELGKEFSDNKSLTSIAFLG
jgi:hypothetical protein